MSSKQTSFLLFLLLALVLQATPVQRIGALSVQNGVVVGSSGAPANLRGMSFFWNIAPEARDYYNASVVNWLADDWHATLVRAAMAVEDNWGSEQEGYEYQPVRNRDQVATVVDAAIAKGIYVIIDWHSHWSADPSNTQRRTKAIEFFEDMARTYGQHPNVIYEVYNEPGFDASQWQRIKEFNMAVVDAIRAIDPDNLIIVGTPHYSSSVDVATADPLPASYTNIAYSFHMYASDAGHDSYRARADLALSRGHALFVSEWGVSQASGGGDLDWTRIEGWRNWMTQNNLCWAAWSIVNKSESSAALYTSASAQGGWSQSNLTPAGIWYRNTLRELNPPWDEPVATLLPAIDSPHPRIRSSAGTLLVQSPGEFSLRLLDMHGREVVPWQQHRESAHLEQVREGVYLIQMRTPDSPNVWSATASQLR